MTKANECTCPSGDGSLRHPCPAHPASVELAGVAANLTFINGRPAMCGCQVEYSSGGGEYSDVIYVTLCAKHSGSAILDLVATNRIALTPEYEGQWHADLYLDREIPLAKAEGATPAEAVLALMSAERIDPEQESVGQAGGDERVIGWRERILAAHPNSDPGFWPDALLVEHMAAEIADLRAALAQPSPVRSSLLINGYQLRAALEFIAPDGTAKQLESEARIEWRQQDADFLEAGLYAWCAEYPEEGCVLLDEEPTTSQPSPAQAKKAEVERPEVVAVMESNGAGGKRLAQRFPIVNVFVGDELMTVAQHERIVKAWIERWKAYIELSAKIAAQRDAANARLHEVATACATAEQQRDAALARVTELENQEPVAWMDPRSPEMHATISNEVKQHNMRIGNAPASAVNGYSIPLYAAPVAQAQQLHDLDKQCRDDVARALGLRPSQERGFAWSYLLASIKSCVKASEDAAQAQHSVPAYVSYTTRPAESLAGIALRQLKDESRWVEIRDINAHTFPDMQSHSYYPAGTVIKLPAAAPGKEGV
ncbi:LysM peptidoglycan-binding domain-containing protein [Pseudomonas aeruginosa]|uniref:LysM peptidoglycan-binding domain-containing protein n=2 Tax=Pseudomonas aeruginosa TaxID=287 RepID=UPI001C8EDDEA|nr:hypothetical protein [Pseudomonas aeruginosa]